MRRYVQQALKKSELSKFLTLAQTAALEAGALIQRFQRKALKVSYKGEVDLVTNADRAAQDAILRKLTKKYPTHSFLGEESLSIDRGSDFKWIIDPIDGTTNFVHGYPVYAVSIGLEIEGELSLGVVYNPCSKEMFFAIKGGGAFLNKKPIRVSTFNSLATSMLATGFPYARDPDPHFSNVAYHNHLLMMSQAIRRGGSAELDLCFVACGRIDGFWEYHLSPWDTAAGAVIVREAGGQVSDSTGGAFSVYEKSIVATNGRIHAEIVSEIRKTRATRSG